jgi:hypothetical protein
MPASTGLVRKNVLINTHIDGVILMKIIFKQLAASMLTVSFLVVACVAMAEEREPSGRVVIDETQIMWVIGGDIGGGTLEFQGRTYPFKMGGVKLGGFGVHQVKLVGVVYDLYNVGEFAGLYAEAEVGYTNVNKGPGDFWLQNDKGVKLHLQAQESEGIALDMGADGVDILME